MTSWTKILQLFLGTLITFPTVETYTETDSSTQRLFIYWDETAYQANNAKGWEATKSLQVQILQKYMNGIVHLNLGLHNNIVW